jgi:hypothetical protein
MPFSLVYETEAVLLPEVYLKSARVAHFNSEDQTEARELDANLLEERCNTSLCNVRKYQAALKSTTIKAWYRESSTSGS